MDIWDTVLDKKLLGWIPKTENYTKCKNPIPKGYILYDSIKFYKTHYKGYCIPLDPTPSYSDKKNGCVFLSAAWIYQKITLVLTRYPLTYY